MLSCVRLVASECVGLIKAYSLVTRKPRTGKVGSSSARRGSVTLRASHLHQRRVPAAAREGGPTPPPACGHPPLLRGREQARAGAVRFPCAAASWRPCVKCPAPKCLCPRCRRLGTDSDRLGGQSDALGSRSDGLESHPDALGTHPDRLSRHPDGLLEHVGGMGRHFDALRTHSDGLGGQVGSLGRHVGEVQVPSQTVFTRFQPNYSPFSRLSISSSAVTICVEACSSKRFVPSHVS